VWFLWEEGTLLMYSQPGKPKLANIATNPRVSVHLRGTESGGDVVIFEGQAHRSDDPPADRVAAYLEKYRDSIEEYDWTPRSFAEDYSVPIRIVPSALRVW
jgi:PPOX class probable F420-dependent enzyme